MARFETPPVERRAWSLSTHLLVLCLSILVPGIVLGGLALWSLFSAESTSTKMRLLGDASYIAAGIDREILGFTRVAESLASSPLLQEQKFEAFDLQARQLFGLHGWYVILTDRTGKQLVNTTFPKGSTLPSTELARIKDVVETGKPRISDLFFSAGNMPLVGVRIPIISGGETAYVLTVAVPTQIFTPILDRNIGGLNWTVTLADRMGRVIAQSHNHASSVGKGLPGSTLDQLRLGTPIHRVVSNGTEVVRVVDRSALAGWIVSATLPTADLAAIARRGWVTFAALAAALTILSVVLAYLFARRIAIPIQTLAGVPLDSSTSRFPETGLAEANRVGSALFESVRQLEASRQQYQTLVEAANDIIFTTDLEGRFLTCNAAGYLALGYSGNELTGKSFSSLLSDKNKSAHAASESPPVLTGELPASEDQLQRRFEVEVVSRSGRTLVWEVSSQLLRDASGKPESMLSIARDITERRKAEEQIRANEERLRLALAGIGAGVWEYEFANHASTWSPEMLELYGLDQKSFPPSREALVDLVHPDDRERVREITRLHTKKGGPFACEFRVCRPDGRVVWINSRGVIECAADGQPVRIRGIDQDVTAARIAEQHRSELLRTTAQQLNELQSLYNSATVGLALVDREFRFQRINQVLAGMHGYSVEEHLGRLVWDLIPDLRPEVEPILKRILETGEPVTGVEVTGETPARPGDQRSWFLQFYPLKSRDGSVVGIGTICEDVTERRRAQLGRAHLAAIVESSSDAIISWSTDGRLRSWNPGAERMFGYTADEAIGRGTDLLFSPRPGQSSARAFELAMSGKRVQFEALRRRKDGTEIPVSISASPMRDDNGRIAAVSVIYRDISEQKRREEHTRFIMRELSHRSKNLLAVIQAMARQTARTSRDLMDFQDRFTARVRGLAQSHDLLVKRDWRGVPVAELVRAHLGPFVDRSEQGLILSGPSLSLRPEAAQNVGLALHELATNASKHGALSKPTGRIEIRWHVEQRDDGEPRFHMLWRETGGPEVVKPRVRGFGHTVIDAMVGRALEGEAHLEWRREGLVWRLDAAASCIAPEISVADAADLLPEGVAGKLNALDHRWHELREKSGGLPPPSAIDIAAHPESDAMFLATLGPSPDLKFVKYLHIGDTLRRRLGWRGEAETTKRGWGEILGSLEDCRRSTVASRRPCYEWARVNVGGEPLEFECLLLPFSEDRKTASHMLGIVAFKTAD